MSSFANLSAAGSTMSVEEAAIRWDLAACYRLVAYFGWDDPGATHISARIPGPEEAFLINPYDMLFEEVTAASLIKINAEGDILEPTAYRINRTAFVIHSAILTARPDVACVMHLHTKNGVAVSCLKEGLLPLTQTAMHLTNDLAFHDFQGVAEDIGERTILQADLGEKNVMLLRNHGTLVMGRSVAEAFVKMQYLENACDTQIRALSTGRGLSEVPAETVALVQNQVTADVFGRFSEELVWPALLRKLERLGLAAGI